MSVSEVIPSELEVLRQRNAELEAKNVELKAKIVELNDKSGVLVVENFDLKNEVAKLKRELMSRFKELEKMEQVSSKVGGKAQNTREAKLEDEKMDAFLIEQNKKKASESTAKNNHRKKGAENIVQLIADGIRDDSHSVNKTNPCDGISAGGPSQNSSTVPHSLAQLFYRATDAKCGAIRANQKEILRWFYYGEEFLIQVRAITNDGKGEIGEKKGKGVIYDKVLEDLSILRKKKSEETGMQLPEISRKCLQGKTQKAVKIFKLFEKLAGGPGPNSAEASVSTAPISEEMIADDQAKTSETQVDPLVPTEGNILTAPHSNSPILDQAYFRNKVLKLYPGISLRRSNELTDIYHCMTKSALCPSCGTNHEENIVGYYKNLPGTHSCASYRIGCMFRYTGDLEVAA
ncbi:hypothetical protein GLOIN_2v1785207 [Rhizophagus irregularis DAOM 181602=DAOM 197198]|uniref:Uncharacterized protein n=2 Tax=Rhizophagus irregularis (strain DAOM 181602 / DAOM 197198 / MUCL 43194) TaxID=747089 RepID=A0A2P4PAQ7_RHIID|nr:hypothetical protein GLOIN_2v1785207 [Rhizophagus irregularis DAOM 181602=DAOM 197198]POG62486.1 hypothetical protein GLOIN_2v1785207 [Rhizophagus irregularis DAOM 181602=DAOM 197198]|eukprot:XP_025169352.1 hypothetical protein GLOIN_2v1785207 [Rhizophagus irregularis DAOM 181602=DAOM 197198]